MEKKSIGTFLAFIILMLTAILLIISNLLPMIGIEIKGALVGILALVKDLAVLIVIGVGAFAFVKGKKKWLKIAFWVAVAIYVACVVLGLFK
ncbi:MAG: hypothetical protein IKC71_01720 [Clostridia bacterium]|nr:hypothetical protein [Clostridia bacterium]